VDNVWSGTGAPWGRPRDARGRGTGQPRAARSHHPQDRDAGGGPRCAPPVHGRSWVGTDARSRWPRSPPARALGRAAAPRSRPWPARMRHHPQSTTPTTDAGPYTYTTRGRRDAGRPDPV